jgi:glutathione S-transferase
VFYTPVAARIVGYDLPVSAETRAYSRLLLSDPAVLAWQREARKVSYDPEPYALSLKRRDWRL